MNILNLDSVDSPSPSATALHNSGTMRLYAWDGTFTILANAKLNVYSISKRNKRGSLYKLGQGACWVTSLSSMMQTLEESGSWQPYVTTEHVNQDGQPKQGTCDHIEVRK
jgi:hypothetical protein